MLHIVITLAVNISNKHMQKAFLFYFQSSVRQAAFTLRLWIPDLCLKTDYENPQHMLCVCVCLHVYQI